MPVRFHSQITELGVFELWCVSTIPTTVGNSNSASATTLASRLTTLARSVSEEVGRWSCSSVLANASG